MSKAVTKHGKTCGMAREPVGTPESSAQYMRIGVASISNFSLFVVDPP